MLKISILYKIRRQITREFLGLRMRNFEGMFFILTISNFQICISAPLRKEL